MCTVRPHTHSMVRLSTGFYDGGTRAITQRVVDVRDLAAVPIETNTLHQTLDLGHSCCGGV